MSSSTTEEEKRHNRSCWNQTKVRVSICRAQMDRGMFKQQSSYPSVLHHLSQSNAGVMSHGREAPSAVPMCSSRSPLRESVSGRRRPEARRSGVWPICRARFLQHSLGVLRSWKRNLPPEFTAANRPTAGVARLAQNHKETGGKQPGAAEEAGRALPSVTLQGSWMPETEILHIHLEKLQFKAFSDGLGTEDPRKVM